MNSTQKPFKTAHSDENTPFHHWSLLRTQLIWAYNRELENTPRSWPFLPYPTPAWLIESGEITLYFREKKERYLAGEWVFPKEAQCLQEFSKGTRILSLRFIAEWPAGKPLFPRKQSHSFPVDRFPSLTQSAYALCSHVEDSFPHSYQAPHITGTLAQFFQLQPYLYNWIQEYYQALQSSGITPTTLSQLHEKVQLALQYMEFLPMAHPLQETTLAQQVGLSRSQLNKIFHRDLGFTPASYWNARRLRMARTQLAADSKSIKTLAYEFGFSSPANFTRWFRMNCKVTPTEFRRLSSGAPML